MPAVRVLRWIQHDRGLAALGTRGEPGYFAPERVLDEGRIDNYMLDTWGIGVTVLRMALGQRQWDSLWMPAYASQVKLHGRRRAPCLAT